MVKYPAGSARHRAINKPAGQSIEPPKAGTMQNLKASKKPTQYGSRGMSLEDRINQSNQYYLSHNLAVIHKKPTPIQVVKVDFPRRSAARITEAYYRQASTTDYNGLYLGRYLDFEAKETTNKTSFPLANLPDHQIEHMRQCHQQGGIVFLVISFKVHDKVYLLPFPALDQWLESQKRKSLPLDYLESHGYLCQQGVFPMIDYLAAVDLWLQAH